MSQPLRLFAVVGEQAGGPWVAAGDRLTELSGRGMTVNRAFLFLLNALMDEITDYVLVHGAAVCLAGKGIIIAGPPTAGKSTLVLELARQGASFLSDDVAPLNRATGLLHRFPRAIGIRREGGKVSRFDPAALPADAVHELAYKWLVDPVALGLRLAGPEASPCRLHAVILLDSGETDPSSPGPETRPVRATRSLEIALAEDDATMLAELRSIPGVGDVRATGSDDSRPFPVYTFTAESSARPMGPLADLARRHRDLVLYMDESRGHTSDYQAPPVLRETQWSSVLKELVRDLLNRSETGRLVASCHGLAGLMSEMGRLLQGARVYRLRPGDPERTAMLVREMATEDPGRMSSPSS
ncbi:MAG TPA: hypothetical protein VFE84_13270 [Patescibacteria group bacterium]|nr:hypothetical protein [Patescibacteria group bacterium]